MSTVPSSQSEGTREDRRRFWRNLWVGVEVAVGAFIAWLFAYGYVNAQTLRRDSGVFPSFLAYVGLSLMAIHLLQVAFRHFRSTPTEAPHADLEDDLDVDDDDVDPKGVARAYGAIISLFVACWLIGFHIAVPGFIVLYSAVWGGVRSWVKLAVTWVVVTLTMIIVYGRFMNTPWPTSVLEEFLGFDWQRLLLPIVEPLLDLIGM